MARYTNITSSGTHTLLEPGDNFSVKNIQIANMGTSGTVSLSIREVNDTGATINTWYVFKGVIMFAKDQLTHEFTFDNSKYGLYLWTNQDADVIIN